MQILFSISCGYQLGIWYRRIPPVGSFAEVNGNKAGDMSASIALQLFEMIGKGGSHPVRYSLPFT